MKNLAVLVSGYGSNLQAIIRAARRGKIRARIALVVSDRKKAYALTRAKRAKIPTLYLPAKDFSSREEYDRELIRRLREKKVDFVVMAGFMRLLSPGFIREYRRRIVNIHPALLPAFKGTEGIKDAFEYGVKITGPTVHFVDEEMDHGPVILQAAIKVENDDTEETLAKKIHRAEHRIYPEAVRLLVEDRLAVAGRKVLMGTKGAWRKVDRKRGNRKRKKRH